MEKAFLIIVSGFVLVAVNAIPALKNGKKITFSAATSLDYEKIRYNLNEPEFGTMEYFESNRWIAVNHEGMQYEGSLEEVLKYIGPVAAEDVGERAPAHPRRPADSADPVPDPSFKALAEAMEDVVHSAEKRSVIGDDTRKLVTNFRFPYNAIGRIDIGCTGTFIAPRTVLTAGHCVHEGDGGDWYDQLTVRRSKDCDPNQGIAHNWNWAVTFQGWTQSGLQTYDIAVITVFEASPVQMPFQAAASVGGGINIAGYPGDKPNRCLWRSYCSISETQEKRLLYPCDTAGGMSGSAVYQYYSSLSHRVIRGVHAYGVGGGDQVNSGTRITDFYETRIHEWINEYDGN